MGFSDLAAPFLGKTLKLLGLAAPLSVLAIITIMVVPAYNEMADREIGTGLDSASSLVAIEFGGLPQTAPPDR